MADPTPTPDPAPEQEDFVARYRREERNQKLRQSATGVGLEFCIGVAVLTGLGYGVDSLLGSFPAFLLVGFFLGLVVAFTRLMQFARRMNPPKGRAS